MYLLLQILFPTTEEITQSSDQVKIRLISQLFKYIPRVLQTLRKNFNGTDISTFLYYYQHYNLEFELFRNYYCSRLQITPLVLSPNSSAASSTPDPVVAIVSLTGIYASL